MNNREPDFEIIRGALTGYKGNGQVAIIPEGVTEIADYAFDYCIDVEEVIIPDSVTSIGKYAFRGCRELVRVKLSSSLKKIDTCAFQNCDKLKYLYFGDDRQTEGTESCVSLPKGCRVTSGAFINCRGLCDKNGLLVIRGCLYHTNSGIGPFVVPRGIKAIDIDAFRQKEVHIVMPLHGVGVRQTASSMRFGRGIVRTNNSTLTLTRDDGSIAAKLIVSADGENMTNVHLAYSSILWTKDGVNYDRYDDCVQSYACMSNKLIVAVLRLLYPYKLSQKRKAEFESLVKSRITDTFAVLTKRGTAEDVRRFIESELVTDEALTELAGYSARMGYVAYTAMILERGRNSDNSDSEL